MNIYIKGFQQRDLPSNAWLRVSWLEMSLSPWVVTVRFSYCLSHVHDLLSPWGPKPSSYLIPSHFTNGDDISNLISSFLLSISFVSPLLNMLGLRNERREISEGEKSKNDEFSFLPFHAAKRNGLWIPLVQRKEKNFFLHSPAFPHDAIFFHEIKKVDANTSVVPKVSPISWTCRLSASLRGTYNPEVSRKAIES